MLNFLDNYNNTSQLVGEAPMINLAHIHVLLKNFISGNSEAETKRQAINTIN